jgi:hypothetical protein
MTVHFHTHALERMSERGITEDEVKITIEHGEQFPAKFGRSGFRRNFRFDSEWHGASYRTKQIETYAVQEGHDWLVITAIARYF